jgi:hypothetical protein
MIQSYFDRFGFCPPQISKPPAADLSLVVVIPCFNEADLLASLESLWQSERPQGAVEVIVVINSAAGSSETVRAQNLQTWTEAMTWSTDHSEERFRLHVLHLPDLPPKQAGVGLARKIGMDEAVRRFDAASNPHGVIVGFDADCLCESNYLRAMERHFEENPRCPGCSVYFEHPLAGEAIAAYELHLRYYVQGLRGAGFPYAYHTLGSCMAVRANIYCEQGGMNKRQAGEDFYFLHKIIPLGHFMDLTETTVFPSARASDRVPFGTGKAVRDYLRDGHRKSYPLAAFLDLQQLLDFLPELFRSRDGSRVLGVLPKAMASFLGAQDFNRSLAEIFGNTSTEAAFRKRFFHWFNAFRVMMFIHHARDNFYGESDVASAAGKLLSLRGQGESAPNSIGELLRVYRELDRGRTAWTRLEGSLEVRRVQPVLG